MARAVANPGSYPMTEQWDGEQDLGLIRQIAITASTSDRLSVVTFKATLETHATAGNNLVARNETLGGTLSARGSLGHFL
jgi:hypothetical protein